MKNLVNKTDAAKLAGISRKTLYAHIGEKGISLTRDEIDGNEKIDISELERVYGLEVVATNRKKLAEEGQGNRSETPKGKHDVTPSHTEIRLIEQAKEIEKLNEIRKIENEASAKRIENLEEALAETRQNSKTYQMLLEDHSKRNTGGGELENGLKALEARIANQEKVTKEAHKETEKYKTRSQKIYRELKREREKSIFRKILGLPPKKDGVGG